MERSNILQWFVITTVIGSSVILSADPCYKKNRTCCYNHVFDTANNRCVGCSRGSYGINCKLRCMSGYYGNLCSSPCECFAHQCDPESGCQGIILTNSPIQEEQNNTRTWMLVIACIVGSVSAILSCAYFFLWISDRCKPSLRPPNTIPTDLDDIHTATVPGVKTQTPDYAEICDSFNSSHNQCKEYDFTTGKGVVKRTHGERYGEKEDQFDGFHNSEYSRLQLKKKNSFTKQYIWRKDKDNEECMAPEKVEFIGMNTERRFYSIPQISQSESQWANRSQITVLFLSEHEILSLDNNSPKPVPKLKEIPYSTIGNELKENLITVEEPQYSLAKFCNIEIEDDRNKCTESQTTQL